MGKEDYCIKLFPNGTYYFWQDNDELLNLEDDDYENCCLLELNLYRDYLDYRFNEWCRFHSDSE